MQTPLSSKYSKGCKMPQLYNTIAMQSEMREETARTCWGTSTSKMFAEHYRTPLW